MSRKYTLGYCAKNAAKHASASVGTCVHSCERLEKELKEEMKIEGEDLALLAKISDRIEKLKMIQRELWELQDYNKNDETLKDCIERELNITLE